MDAWTELDDAWNRGLCEAAEVQRLEIIGPVTDIRKHLHPKQLEVFECDAPAIDLLGGRQCGKTFVDVGWLIEGGVEKPGTINPYFGLTGESVDDIMWPEVVAWWQLLGWDTDDLHQHTHTAVLPTGSTIKGRGTDDKRHIQSRRGGKYNRIVIDEMGAQDDDLVRSFNELLWPTMIKAKGRMIRSGNPGYVLDGYWYDRTKPGRTIQTPLFTWTAWDNPALGTPEQVDEFVSAQIFDACGLTLLEIKERAEQGETDGPVGTYLREWLAKWSVDKGRIVYPFDLKRNGVDALPTHNHKGNRLDPNAWRYIAVCDPAGKGYTGFAVSAAHPDLRRRFIVESDVVQGMLISQAVGQLRGYRAKYGPRTRLMLDAGGLGSTHSQEMAMMFALFTEDAEKTDKASAVNIFRDELIAGSVGILNGPCNDAWRAEAAKCGWDKKKLSHDPDADDHALDCGIYGHRALRTWPQNESGPEPDLSADERYEREAATLKLAAQRRVVGMGANGRPAWDR